MPRLPGNAPYFTKPFLLKHGDKVRLTFHNFPLDGSCNPFAPNGMHPVACVAARNSLCAAARGKFWEYYDQIYDHQQELTRQPHRRAGVGGGPEFSRSCKLA